MSMQACYLLENLKTDKCPIESCKIRMHHYHEDHLVRSRVTPWWKVNQNPQIGQDWENKEDTGDEKKPLTKSQTKKQNEKSN